MDEWGFCGVGCVSDGLLTGYLLVAPALHVPRPHPLAACANADAAALLAVVDDGCGRRLVQSLAARLVGHRTITAIDAAGSELGTALAPSYTWLDEVGFHPLDQDPNRYRLELAGTRSWLPDVAPLLDRLRGIIRPVPPPEPVGRYESVRVRTLLSQPYAAATSQYGCWPRRRMRQTRTRDRS
ncbi:MAG TPA: hypothetical protein PLA44_13230 [Propionibacteriaceae bacterium]|nr:hypothetical protein [Propionibacteriaceae bacterium]